MSKQSDFKSLFFEKTKDIESIVDRIDDLHIDFPRLEKRQKVLMTRFIQEIEKCIDRMEDIYYRHVLRNKDISKIKAETDRGIYVTRKMMDTLFPYVIMSDLLMGSSRDSSQTNPNQPVVPVTG